MRRFVLLVSVARIVNRLIVRIATESDPVGPALDAVSELLTLFSGVKSVVPKPQAVESVDLQNGHRLVALTDDAGEVVGAKVIADRGSRRGSAVLAMIGLLLLIALVAFLLSFAGCEGPFHSIGR